MEKDRNVKDVKDRNIHQGNLNGKEAKGFRNGKVDFNGSVEALFKGLETFLTSKTVVGEPVKVGDATMIPLADVSFGLGAGAFTGDKNNNGGGGLGAKMSPVAVLMIAADGTSKLILLNHHDAVSRIVEMAPDIVNKITGKLGATEEPLR